MRTIRNTALFEHLQQIRDKKGDLWKALFEDTTPKIEFEKWTQLDHIDVKNGGFYFIDVGTNDRDGSFVIRPTLYEQWTIEDETKLKELRRRKARFIRDKHRKKKYAPRTTRRQQP
jgi:hypothetical protein